MDTSHRREGGIQVMAVSLDLRIFHSHESTKRQGEESAAYSMRFTSFAAATTGFASARRLSCPDEEDSGCGSESLDSRSRRALDSKPQGSRWSGVLRVSNSMAGMLR